MLSRSVYIFCVIKKQLKWIVLLSSLCVTVSAHAQSYKYFRLGNKDDVQTKPIAGIAMMGG